jgi:hypothetical protein
MNDRLPLGYETLEKARVRAHENWSVDYVATLRDLLIRGNLPAWKINKSGDAEPLSREFWETKDGHRLLEIRLTDLDRSYHLPVFRLEDLRKLMPTTMELDHDAIERAKIANAVRRAKKEAAPTVNCDEKAVVARQQANKLYRPVKRADRRSSTGTRCGSR